MNPNNEINEYHIMRELKGAIKALWVLLLVSIGFNAHSQTDDFNLAIGQLTFSGTVWPTVDVVGTGQAWGNFTTLVDNGGGNYTLYDLEGAPSIQAAGSIFWRLDYTLSGNTITAAALNFDLNYDPYQYCGAGTVQACVGSVVDPPAMKAPEFGLGAAAEALVLLGGLTLILKSRTRTI